MRFLLALLPLACALAADPLPAPRFTDPQRRAKLEAAFPEIDRIFERFLKDRSVPGMSYGIVVDGEIALVKALGVQDLATRAPATPETVFRIASMTKSFTALAILKLRDEGKLSLDDPIAKWIPEFARMPLPTRDAAPIRIRNLLTHGAGFPEDNPWGDRQLALSDAVLGQWLKKGLPFSTTPDTHFEDSNYGFALLGRIVATVSKMPYRQYLETRILTPLGLKSATLEPSTIPAGVAAVGYKNWNGDLKVEPSLAHGAFGAMGGLAIDARDLGKYVAFHLSAEPPRDDADNGPVRRGSVREMQRLQRPGNSSAGGYAFGLGVARDNRVERTVSHGGGLPGFGSYMLWLPEYGVGFFAMANLTYSAPSGAINEALDALRKTGALQPRKLPPSPVLLQTRDALVSLWNQWSDDKLKAIAADNLFLDNPAAARRAEVEKLKTEMGECKPDGEFQAENWLRGSFRLACAKGNVTVTFTLAPTQPPGVQSLRFSPKTAVQ